MPGTLPNPRSRWMGLVKLGFVLLLIVAANIAAGWFVDDLRFDIRPGNEDVVHRAIVSAAAVYTVLLAVPFVPGAEIGLTLIGLFGPPIVLLVYLCTLAGLTLSFLIGRIVPHAALISLCGRLKMQRLQGLIAEIAPLSLDDRLAFLMAGAPGRIVPFFLRHRYVAIAVLINLPGNVIIGGGGGIAMFAGLSRLFSLPGFLFTIIIAAAPLPLAVLLFGDSLLPEIIATGSIQFNAALESTGGIIRSPLSTIAAGA